MLFYTKVLKQNGKFQFDSIPISGIVDLRVAIKSFFDNHEAGIHVAIVCTDNPNEMVNEEDFYAAPSCDTWSSVNLMPTDGAKPTRKGRVCAHRGSFEFIGQALADVLKCAKQIIGEHYISNKTDSLISATIVYEEQGLLSPEGLWSDVFAKSSSEIMDTNQLKLDHQTVPDIRILLCLPQKHFEVFSNPRCYFPEFLEYVVLGEDGVVIFQENQALKEKIRQLEEKCQQLTKENQAYGQAQTKLEQFTKEVYQKSNELLIQFQKIDTHDRFGKRAIEGIDPRIAEYPQSLGRQPDETGETSINKEKRDQIEPADFEAQTIKLTERSSGHIGEGDKQLDSRTDHKESRNRSDDRDSMGR